MEPVFGIIKEQQGARRFLLRGLGNVTAEWTLLATAFNLRTLWRIWRTRGPVYPVSPPANRPRPIVARTTANRLSWLSNPFYAHSRCICRDAGLRGVHVWPYETGCEVSFGSGC